MSLNKTRSCRNCGVDVGPLQWIPLCKDCRRAVQIAFLVGGFLCGFVVKALTHWGWL